MKDLEKLKAVGAVALANGSYHSAEEIASEAQRDDFCDLWEIRNLSHAYQERPPWQYVVDGLIPRPSLCTVYGGPGSLKSMLLADLAACVAGGQRWLQTLSGSGQQPGISFAVQQSPILWIDFDNGTRRTDERMEAVTRIRGLPTDAPFHYVSMPRPWLDISQTGMTESLSRKVKALGARLVIIDNLGLITGDTEENSARMAQVMGNLRWLCEETESAVIVVHHQRKSGGAGDKGIRKGESLRGHSSIEAALDMAMVVERTPGEDKIAAVLTKVRGYAECTVFGAMFTYEHREGTHDLSAARFFSQAVDTAANLENMAIEAVILRILNEVGALNKTDLVQKVRDNMAASPGGKAPGVNKVRGIIDNLHEGGEITMRDGEKTEKLYTATGL